MVPPMLYGLMAAGVLVEVLVERDDLDGAVRALGPLAADLSGVSLTASILRHASGRLLFAQHRFGEALGDLRAAGEIATGGLAISPCWLPWRSEAALAALAIGEPDTARGLSDEELELARAFGPSRPGPALRAAGPERAEHAARPCCAKRSRCAAGQPSNRHGHDERGCPPAPPQPARRGPLPAPPSSRRRLPPRRRRACPTGRDRAARHRSRARRVLLSGLEALTASERRIAELAAEGLTTARSLKPCSSPPGRSRATSPTCSPSSTSRPAPPYRPPWQLPPSSPRLTTSDRAIAQSPGGLPVVHNSVKTNAANRS